MKFSKSLIFLSSLAFTMNVFASTTVDRFKMLDDKLKTDAMLRPIGHDFFLDLNASINGDLMDVVKDISDVSKTGDATAALNTLNKYSNTEQTVKLNLALGFPIFSFSIKELKVKPNFRVFGDMGANIGITTAALTAADLAALFPVAIPAELTSFILTLSPGDDVITQCTASGTLSTETKAFCSTQPTGKYIIPAAGAPKLAFFAKLDVKGGLFNEYEYGEHFFGNFNLYALNRTDIYQTASATSIANGTKIELPSDKNTETTMQMDYRLGYKNDNYRASLSLEDVKIATLKERKSTSRELSYTYSALIRAHGEADYRFSSFSLMPYAGVHKRSGYGLADGIYAGAIAGAHLWGDRLGLMLKGQLDKQYFTISPRIKLWVMQLEYSMKAPVKTEDNGLKLSTIHSVNLRLFF